MSAVPISDTIDHLFEAYVAHLVGEASTWRPGSGSHPPGLVKAVDELCAYYYSRAGKGLL